MWKIRRNKKPPASVPSPLAFLEPALGQVPDTELEIMVQKVLEAASKEAESLEPGTPFEVSIDLSEVPADVPYIEILNQLSVRSSEHGFESDACRNWTFEFTKK